MDDYKSRIISNESLERYKRIEQAARECHDLQNGGYINFAERYGKALKRLGKALQKLDGDNQ